MDSSRSRSASSPSTSSGHATELGLRNHHRAAAALEVPRVQRLVVRSRVRVGDEDGRRPCGRELPHRPAGARDGQVRRGERRAELVRRLHEHVVLSVDTVAQALVVALAGDVEHSGAGVAVRRHGEVVQAARAGERAEDRDHRPGRGQAEAPPALGLAEASMSRRHRPSRDAVLGAVTSWDLVGEKDAARERSGEAVRETEMRVGLRQRGRQLAAPRGVDHRACDVAAAAEDDVRQAALQDRGARTRRRAGCDQRPHELDRGTARQARNLEGVELVPRFRDEPSLDAIRRPGERHRGASQAQRLRHGERRQDVTRGSAGGDQTPQLLAWRTTGGRVHRPRC